MNVIFLDDNNERHKSIKGKLPLQTIYVFDAKECIDAIKGIEEIDMIFLDHDLGGEEFVSSDNKNCGMEVVRWIVENEPFIRNIIVHSLNGPAAKEMVAKLVDARYKASYLPFTIMIKNLEKFKYE